MPSYAADTSVSVDRSIAEVRGTVLRYGATGFAYGEEDGRAAVMFTIDDRRVRIVVPLPSIDEQRFRLTPARGTQRTPAQQREQWEQACRQRWRALAFVVKAKLEAIEAGIAEFETEFLGYLVLPGGQTVREHLGDQLAPALAGGAAGSLLALPAGT